MKINKMAACSINIAEELYSLLTIDPYETDVQTIDADTQPNPEELKKIRKLLDKAYKLDTSRFQTRRGNCIPNSMFDLFELTLYALCKLYHQHAVVYTMAGMWTTVKDGVLLNEFDLMEKCDIKLLNLGGHQYGVLTKLETTNKRLKVKEIASLHDELIHIRENTEKTHNTRPRKRLNYKDMSEGRSPTRPTRKQPYKPLPGAIPSESRVYAQETIEKIRKSRIVGSVSIKTEDEKPKVKIEKDLISSNTGGQKRTNDGGHCPKHCPKAKRTKTDNADPEDTLPDLPVSSPIEASENTRDTIK